MLISKTGWSQQRLSPPCNLKAPDKVISSGTAFQLHSPWMTPSHVPKQSSRGTFFMKLSWTSIPRVMSPSFWTPRDRYTYFYYSNSCGLQLGAILQKRLLLLDLNVCFLSSCNFPYPLNNISITSSPAFLQGSTIFEE